MRSSSLRFIEEKTEALSGDHPSSLSRISLQEEESLGGSLSFILEHISTTQDSTQVNNQRTASESSLQQALGRSGIGDSACLQGCLEITLRQRGVEQ